MQLVQPVIRMQWTRHRVREAVRNAPSPKIATDGVFRWRCTHLAGNQSCTCPSASGAEIQRTGRGASDWVLLDLSASVPRAAER